MVDLDFDHVRPELKQLAIRLEEQLQAMEEDLEDSPNVPLWLRRVVDLAYGLTVDEFWTEVVVDDDLNIVSGQLLQDTAVPGKTMVFLPNYDVFARAKQTFEGGDDVVPDGIVWTGLQNADWPEEGKENG